MLTAIIGIVVDTLAAAAVTFIGTGIVKANAWLDVGRRRGTLRTVGVALAAVSTVAIKLAEGKLEASDLEGYVRAAIVIAVEAAASWAIAHFKNEIAQAGEFMKRYVESNGVIRRP
jgi:hypothetical protein